MVLDYSTTNRSGTCTHDGTTTFGLSYSYPSSPGNNGLFSGITDSVDSGRSATYTYDSLYRLVTATTPGSANYPAWGLQEGYDRYGNRNTQSVISGCTGITCPPFSTTASTTTNRLPSPYTYDSSGNMAYDGFNTLVYDAENHATSATNSGAAGAYVYDGKGLRVQKCLPNCTNPTTSTVYVFSGSKVLAEYDNGAAVTSPSREYIYSGAALLARIDSSGTRYYHQDHLSNRLVTDSSGNTLEQLGHFPYGEQWYNASGDKLYFTTYERDSESGNDYAQARYNVSRPGRFSSPDPVSGSISDPQSFNRYSYVRNMPAMLTDPMGTCPGGFAENRDLNQQGQGEEHAGGPFLSDGDFEAAYPAQQMGGHWNLTPGPCPGWNDQGGGGSGMDVNNLTTLDGEDIGQIPSGLMGSGQSNDTYYGFGLGFSLTMENGPFGAYFNPETEGCYGSSALGGITCGAIEFPNGANPANPFKFSDMFGQLWPPGTTPPTSFTLLPPDATTNPPPAQKVPKPAGNAPPKPGNVTPNLAPCNPALLAAPGILGGAPSVYPMPASGPLFLALPSGTLLQGVPGLTCST